MMVDESNGFIHPTCFAGFLSTTYDTNLNKTPFLFWENPSKLPNLLHQVWSPPLNPQSDLKKLGPTFHLSPHRNIYAPLLIAFQISSLRFPPNGAPYPQATGHCPTSRFHVDVSWHKSQASAVLGRPVLRYPLVGSYPPPECQSAPGMLHLPRQNWVGFHSNPLVTCCKE